jgi:hypothetical protein
MLMWLKENRVLCISRSTPNIIKTNKIIHIKACTQVLKISKCKRWNSKSTLRKKCQTQKNWNPIHIELGSITNKPFQKTPHVLQQILDNGQQMYTFMRMAWSSTWLQTLPRLGIQNAHESNIIS